MLREKGFVKKKKAAAVLAATGRRRQQPLRWTGRCPLHKFWQTIDIRIREGNWKERNFPGFSGFTVTTFQFFMHNLFPNQVNDSFQCFSRNEGLHSFVGWLFFPGLSL